MYLSRLILNPRSRRVQKELADPYQLHRSLMRSFPDKLPANERVLFRVGTDPRAGVPTILLQSHTPPDWAWLAEDGARGYLLSVDGNPATKPFNPTFAAGQTLAFRLRANPTAKRRFNEKEHKRVGLYREEEQMDWLKRKAEQGGFVLLSARAGNETRVSGVIHRSQDETHKLDMLAVQFDGLLQVADPGRFLATLQNGIGSGKGLGFGLLSVARPTT